MNEYNTIRKNIKKESKKATISFEQRLANDKKNPKLLYAYVNSRQKVKVHLSALKNNQNTVTNNKQEIASILNDQFSSVFVNELADETLPEFAMTSTNN